MAFSGIVEGLNMASRSSQAKKAAHAAARQAELNQRETAEPGV